MRLAMGTREVFDAESLLEEYLTPRRRGRRRAWPAYDGLETNGQPGILCTGDLLAPNLLGAPVDLDRMATLTALLPLLQRGLSALPDHATLQGADDAVLDKVAALYDPLDDPDIDDEDLKGSLIAKVLHRKRPDLIPLYDSRVLTFYRGDAVPPARRGERSWREYMQLLVRAMRQDLRDNSEEFTRLAKIAPADGPRLTPLRVLDIVVWMSSAV
jgi:Family of unknown function (DUF6308)